MTAPDTGRHVLGEYLLEGTLVADAPLALGSGEPGPFSDSACVRDGQGRLIIPGTALAGVLRPDVARAEWGSPERASLVWFEDAVALDGVLLELRDGVGIDRNRGTAARGVLYNREVIPKGTRFRLLLRVEAVERLREGVTQAEAKTFAEAVAASLASGVALGGRTSAGLGRVRLTAASLTWQGTGLRAGLLAFLTDPTPRTPLDLTQLRPDPASTRTPGGRLRVTVPWHATSPLLVSVAHNGLVDRIPQTARTSETDVRLVVPGTSLKGVLRSRAEWIVRTVTGPDAPDDFADQLAQSPELVGLVFGQPPNRRAGERGRSGAAQVHEVYSSEPLRAWEKSLARLSARRGTTPVAVATSRSEANAALRKGRQLQINDHVAISRWTGGADEGKLFATVAPMPPSSTTDGGGVRWDDLVVDLDLDRVGGEQQVLGAIMLVALVVRDFAEGWLGIGHGTTRGYGEVTADPEKITFECSEAGRWGLPESSFTLADFFADAAVRAPCEEAWHAMITASRGSLPARDVTAVEEES